MSWPLGLAVLLQDKFGKCGGFFRMMMLYDTFESTIITDDHPGPLQNGF